MITRHEVASYDFWEQETNVNPAKLISRKTEVLHQSL